MYWRRAQHPPEKSSSSSRPFSPPFQHLTSSSMGVPHYNPQVARIPAPHLHFLFLGFFSSKN